MNKRPLFLIPAILALVLYAGLSLAPAHANMGDPRSAPPDPVKADHRACQYKDDCALISIGCSLCGANGYFESVNKKFADTYASTGQCTDNDKKQSAASQCLAFSDPTATCVNKQCAVKWVPKNKPKSTNTTSPSTNNSTSKGK